MTSMAETSGSDPAILEGSNLVERLTGVMVPEYRRPLLRAELERIGGQEGVSGGIHRVVSGDSKAKSELISTVTIPETYLFRHFGHFEIIREMAMDRAESGKGTRVLSAGCSTGEEVWSAAAMLATVPFTPGVRHEVLGWELCGERLRTARDGRYREWSCRNGLKGLDRFFDERDGMTEAGKVLRGMVSFDQVNLVDGEQPNAGLFDAVLLRNVAIYWSEETCERVSAKLASLIAPDGLLLVGPSDPVQLDPGEWEQRISGGVRSYRRRDRREETSEGSNHLQAGATTGSPEPAATTVRTRVMIFDAADRIRAPFPGGGVGLEKTNEAGRLHVDTGEILPTDSPEKSCLDRAREMADMGEYAAARALLENDDEGSTVDGKLWRGILSLSLEEDVEAVRLFRQCVFLRPDVAEFHRWLSVGLQANGRDEEAERCRKYALELGGR